MPNDALNTMARIEAARKARITETNSMGHQSEALRTSTNTLTSSFQRGNVADRNLANAMARLK
ncbi:hypothetical protein pEaSNUABM8_00083 [Erwinia phage pEa_SNUABM_8]|nr:hypothetical protein pEaSNUABM8_00083 [Erwinia phage pEa_SNUABM_8]QVW54835.1 hypothetical protein pEaSNUABM4_00082 [Erwinia phage pEa_SNUABM_4]